ncbi:MAG: DUF3488 and transglutaminase-like domain-containing protein [Aquificaceae bacterium]|nr:DUF3488 and transglutaminase-like domain-containing protein [Aquificaceae bacterium]MDW8434158.1 DUF3488 and transglutaminase-like domain-containing protein [Aquificaceae bacterium]
MLGAYLNNTKSITYILVYLTSFIGILSLLNVAQVYYFFTFLFLFLLGIYMDYRNFYPVRRPFLNIFAVTFSLYFLSFLSLEDLISPLSHVLLLLISVKSIEQKKPRDLYQMLLLSLFAVSLSTIYNLKPTFLLVFLLHSFMGVCSLVFLNAYRKVDEVDLKWSQIKSYALSGSALFLLVAFAMPLFFFFLPRTQTPILDFLSRGGLKTGFTDSVSLGKVGEIQEDNSVVFRVYGLPQNMREPYWRMIVFGSYWRQTWLKVKEDVYYVPKGVGSITYTLMIEPTYDNIIPALDYPYSLINIEGMNANYYMTTGNVLRLQREINRTIRVTVSSSQSMLLLDRPEPYLQVPQDISPNLRKMAEELSRGANSNLEKLDRVIQHFSKGYQYSLKLEKYEGDPLDYFIFVSKKGNCEYYASATALLLRLMGVPARLVGGYKGAVWNPYGGYHIVTNAMAHVWVEAYVDGFWIRVDTTPPYVAPAVQNISLFALIRDAMVNFWYSNVVGYSSEKQIKLFRQLGESFKKEVKVENIKLRVLQILLLFASALTLYVLINFLLRLRKTPENLYLSTRELLSREKLIEKDALPEEILSACRGREYYKLVKFILSIYQRHKYSPYRIYPDEIKEGYRALKKLKEVIHTSRRS